MIRFEYEMDKNVWIYLDAYRKGISGTQLEYNNIVLEAHDESSTHSSSRHVLDGYWDGLRGSGEEYFSLVDSYVAHRKSEMDSYKRFRILNGFITKFVWIYISELVATKEVEFSDDNASYEILCGKLGASYVNSCRDKNTLGLREYMLEFDGHGRKMIQKFVDRKSFDLQMSIEFRVDDDGNVHHDKILDVNCYISGSPEALDEEDDLDEIQYELDEKSCRVLEDIGEWVGDQLVRFTRMDEKYSPYGIMKNDDVSKEVNSIEDIIETVAREHGTKDYEEKMKLVNIGGYREYSMYPLNNI
jgi:hypothetical protein